MINLETCKDQDLGNSIHQDNPVQDRHVKKTQLRLIVYRNHAIVPVVQKLKHYICCNKGAKRKDVLDTHTGDAEIEMVTRKIVAGAILRVVVSTCVINILL